MIIGISLLTRYELSTAKVIPLKVHLGVDVAGGALLAISSWLFGFADLIWSPHLLVGFMEIVSRLSPGATASSTQATPPADRFARPNRIISR